MAKLVESERLILRDFEENDLMTFYQYRNDEEVAKYQSWNPSSFLETKELLSRIMQGSFDFNYGSHQFAIELKKFHYHIGDLYVSIDELNRKKCFLGYTLMRNFWGYGYAQEACHAMLDHIFHHTLIDEIHALILPMNKRSTHLINKLGFVPIGGIEYCLYKMDYLSKKRNNLDSKHHQYPSLNRYF